jgi:hypothetical protein
MSTSTAVSGRPGSRARRPVAAAVGALALAGGLLAAYSLAAVRPAAPPFGGAVSTGQQSISSVERDRWYRDPNGPDAGASTAARDRWYRAD